MITIAPNFTQRNYLWTAWKDILSLKKFTFQYEETSESYIIWGYDGPEAHICIIYKGALSDSLINSGYTQEQNDADKTNFEESYESLGNGSIEQRDTIGYSVATSTAFSDASGFRFRGDSFIDDVDSDTTKDIDYKLLEDRWVNGGILIVSNVGLTDKFTFQVVDKDNILGYGAGTVLDEFIKDYYVPSSPSLEISLAYPAKIIANLYLRLKYTSTHASGSSVKCNLYLHKKT